MRFRIRGKMFHSFDPRMLRRGWKGGMIHEPAGFLMFILCGIGTMCTSGSDDDDDDGKP